VTKVVILPAGTPRRKLTILPAIVAHLQAKNDRRQRSKSIPVVAPDRRRLEIVVAERKMTISFGCLTTAHRQQPGGLGTDREGALDHPENVPGVDRDHSPVGGRR